MLGPGHANPKVVIDQGHVMKPSCIAPPPLSSFVCHLSMRGFPQLRLWDLLHHHSVLYFIPHSV